MRSGDRWQLFWAGLAWSAFLPLLVLNLLDLWATPATRYLTLVLPVAAWCIWQYSPDSLQPAGFLLRPLAKALYYSGYALLAVAAACWSPWLGTVALLMSGGGWLLWRAPHALRIYSPVWVLVTLLAVPMVPHVVSDIFYSSCQTGSTLLDILAIDHLRRGAMFQLPRMRLFLADCGLDVPLLAPLMVVSVVYSVLMRRGYLCGLILLGTVPGWYWLLNSSVVPLIAQFALSAAVPALPPILFVLAMFLLVCTDQLILFLLDPIFQPVGEDEENDAGVAPDLSPLAHAWNFVFRQPRNISHSHAKGSASSAPPLIQVACFSVALLAIQWYLWMVVGDKDLPEVARKLSSFQAEVLPHELRGWTRTDFHAPRESSERFALGRVTSWTYESGDQRATATLAYLPSWRSLESVLHPPTWKSVERPARIELEGSGHDPFAEAEFGQTSGAYGYLAYCLLDGNGRVIERNDQRLLGNLHFSAKQGPVYLARLFITTDSILLADERDELRSLFDELRSTMSRGWSAREEFAASTEDVQ